MHSGNGISLWSVLLVISYCTKHVSTRCTVMEKGTNLSLSSLVQFYGEGPNNDSLKHIFLLTTNALNKLTLSMSNYTLPVDGGLLPDSSSCPADCLTSLTAYMNEKEKTVVMLRPTDVVNFPGFSIMGIDAIYCTTNEGFCGANVPVYLYHSATDKDYYIGLASENRSNYAVQNSGKPHCFMWSNVNYTTTTSPNNQTTIATSENVTSLPAIGKRSRIRRSSRFWPIALAAVVLLGAVVLTVLALSSLRIIRGNKDRVAPQKISTSPPPPYNPYSHDPGATSLPPAPFQAMSAPRLFTVGGPMPFSNTMYYAY
ncbi:hypothetical protein V3C99_014964 [Haemonchus contortus]